MLEAPNSLLGPPILILLPMLNTPQIYIRVSGLNNKSSIQIEVKKNICNLPNVIPTC